MRFFPGRRFVTLDCSGSLQIGAGVTSQIATLRRMPGKKFLRLTGLAISTNAAVFNGTPDNLLSCTVPGLAPLLDNLPFARGPGILRVPLMHEIDGESEGSFSITSLNNQTYFFRLDGFYHDGAEEEDWPDLWRPHERSIPWIQSGSSPAAIANGSEGTVMTFDAPGSGSGVRVFGCLTTITQTMIGRWRFLGEGFESYRDCVLPIGQSSLQNEGYMQEMLAVLKPRAHYEVRFQHNAGVIGGNAGVTLFGWTLP